MKRRLFVLLVCIALVGSLFAQGTKETTATKAEGPLKISMFYSDNATLPFKSDWLTVKEAEKRSGVQVEWEIIPIAYYQTKSRGAEHRDQRTGRDPLPVHHRRERFDGAHGAIVRSFRLFPVDANFNARVMEFGQRIRWLSWPSPMQAVQSASLFDVPFYDGGSSSVKTC
jgi:putative aldouronate transport system substrate-binding protein